MTLPFCSEVSPIMFSVLRFIRIVMQKLFEILLFHPDKPHFQTETSIRTLSIVFWCLSKYHKQLLIHPFLVIPGPRYPINSPVLSVLHFNWKSVTFFEFETRNMWTYCNFAEILGLVLKQWQCLLLGNERKVY